MKIKNKKVMIYEWSVGFIIIIIIIIIIIWENREF